MHSRQSACVIKHQVSELIGASPLLQLHETANGSRVLLKLEQFNPTGTAKIRMARQMIDEAEAQGLLLPGGRSSSPPPATPAWAWR
ncbi:pyridoxal-phosphate dependent enzyme [Pseudomonas piscis]|uniref:pyridoxal-phosphate dependent enzyme n=1 Tax=Pseudomonas piscis TaxID=2614538 RepID=UPI0003B363DB|nr:pyridoxal-phosphate dependent enzyme [Pseudomonas piscis]ERO61028.1 hypothetical protein P308_00960 [Pseudomonas piscis]